MKTPRLFPALALLTLPMSGLWADVKLPPIISSHMVLENAAKVPIWGKADPGEEVTVTLNGQTVKATTGQDGKWMAYLDLKDSKAGPFEMTVQGKNKITVPDVVVGQVWVASGQSNMEFTLPRSIGGPEEIAKSANPLLRQFLVVKKTSKEPLDECQGTWVAAGPGNSERFTAVGYYFGKKLQQELQIPIGLIHSSWGGTPSEAWTSEEALDTVPDLKAAKERFRKMDETLPADLAKFATDFSAWLKDKGREDHTDTKAADYAEPASSPEGWVAVNVPGQIKAEGLPANGAIWLRNEVTIAPTDANRPLRVDLGILDSFVSVYWNGQLIKKVTAKDFPGSGTAARFDVPANLVKEGKNLLALRFFAPVAPLKLLVQPKAGAIVLANGWQAKSEFALPALDAATVASAPKPPVALPEPQGIASYLFNSMINPLLPYAIRGVIWYQGENNAGRAEQYRTAFPLMIQDWRKKWNLGDFPFYYCELASYQPKNPEPVEAPWAELRDAQAQALKLPNTGRAILIDLGETGDIHPRNKRDVGERLALVALAKDDGKDIPYSGPSYKSMTIEGNKVRVKFDNVDGGLVAKPLPETYNVKTIANQTDKLVRNSPQSEVEGFAICGDDHKWVWADAKIDGDDVIVWSDKVAKPVAVRYAWASSPTCNLYNKADLPAPPFRTDDFPGKTAGVKY